MNEAERVVCTCCGDVLGRYTQVEDKVWLQVGPVKLYAAHGICAQCGTEWHWASTDKELEDLLAHLADL